MEQLEARSTALGQRVTTLRRQVLALLLNRGGRASAYELINDLPSIGRRSSPTPVYRALDFLMEIGLVKRLSSTNTFIVSPESGPDDGGEHPVFLVCASCGAVQIVASPNLKHVLAEAARESKFRLEGGHTEVKGVCSTCQQQPARAWETGIASSICNDIT